MGRNAWKIRVAQGSVNGKLPGFDPGDEGSIPSPYMSRYLFDA